MANERATGAAGGAMQGAQAGFAVGGPWGAAAGAVIGGVAGLFGGSQAARARQMANKARMLERKMSLLAAAVARRDMIRGARISRAESLARITGGEGESGLSSSAPLGALASTGSQFAFNMNYFDTRIRNWLQVQKFVDRAGKYANRSANTGALMDMTASAVSSFGSIKGVTPSQLPSTDVYGAVGTPPIQAELYPTDLAGQMQTWPK